MAKHKVYKTNPLRKYIILSLFIFLFIGLGYSILSTSLGVSGNVDVWKHDQTLYGVLEHEARKGTYAKEYTGEHQDSMNTSLSTKNIYHWYGGTVVNGNVVKEKNNVIFANHCWQMIRTTDTGGVKLLYNGEVDNGQCLSTRGNHVGYSSKTTQSLSSTYYYGTNYTYDSNSNLFSLTGTVMSGSINVGEYICKSELEDGTCSTLYYVDSLANETSYNVLILNNNSHYSQFGTLSYNLNYRSPTYVGYMYGDVYNTSYINSHNLQSISKTTQTVLYSSFFGSNYWYSATLDYGNITPDRYSLVNAYQIEDSTGNQDLVGKYTFATSDQNFKARTAQYIVGVNGSTMYYVYLHDGELVSDYEPIVFGESIVYNGDNTYTLGTTESTTLTNWYQNYGNYVNKYICNNRLSTCSSPRYLTATTKTNYTYVDLTEKYLIAKERNGLSLLNTLVVRADDIVKNYSNYSDYKYTCNTESSVCSESSLRIITSFNSSGYTYADNLYFGSSVSWDGTNYTLIDPVSVEDTGALSTHHYFCQDAGAKVCQNVNFLYLYRNSKEFNYITLKNGVTKGSKALEDMLTKNTSSSLIKRGVEAWYKNYLLNYDNYIEDTVFCNSREFDSTNYWNDEGTITSSLMFSSSGLECKNETDQFCTTNNKAKTNYKVGLLSRDEVDLFHNARGALKSGKMYWLATPYSFKNEDDDQTAFCYVVHNQEYSTFTYDSVSTPFHGVRPVISLKPGIIYLSGDGSMANPYVVSTN